MYQIDLKPGEELILRVRPLWRSFIVFLIGILVCGVGPFTQEDPPLSIKTGLIISAIFLLIIARRWSNLYILTNRRVVVRGGLFARDNMEIALHNVRDIEMHQGVTLRLVQAGHLLVRSQVPNEENIIMYGQPDPQGLKERLQRLVDYRKKEIPPEADSSDGGEQGE